MHILIITNLFYPHILGGYEILCKQVCADLKQRGHRVTVLTTNNGIADAPHAPAEPDVLRHLSVYLPFRLPAAIMRTRRWRIGRRNYAATAAAIRATQPDLIFIWSQLRLTVGPACAAQDSGLPIAYTMNDFHVCSYLPAPFSLRPRGLAAYLLDRFVMPSITMRGLRFDHVTCISRVVRDTLRSRGISIPKARIIYQAIIPDAFPLKEYPGRCAVPARILYTGQLSSEKGVHTLIEGVSLLAGKRPKLLAGLTIVGAGSEEYQSHLHALAASCPVPVHFSGKLLHHQLPALYREHDIFVFPSLAVEAFGLTQLEAMASGTPVVSTFRGGHGEILSDGVNALLFEDNDAASLADCIERLLDNPDLAEQIARAARAMIDSSFNLDRYVDEIDNFLSNCHSEGRP